MRLDDLQTPFLVIRLDRVRSNLVRMKEMLAGDLGRWRPHIKTTKIPAVISMLLDASVRRFKCATSREARVLLEQAPDPVDLLVAMPHHGANLQRIIALSREHPRHHVSVLSEDPDHAERSRRAGLGVFVDLDPGYHRTGIPLSDRKRITTTMESAGSALRGLHYYDGHLHDGTPADRATACARIYAALMDLHGELGRPDIELTTSGTPTFPHALEFTPFRDVRHTVSPGTVVYWDLRSERLSIPGFEYAAMVRSTVVSRTVKDRVTCDAGSKALDAAAGDPCAEVLDWPGLRALRPSEEHLPLEVVSGPVPAPGERIYLVPTHVCPTVNLADHAALVDGDRLTVVPVTARGHELRSGD